MNLRKRILTITLISCFLATSAIAGKPSLVEEGKEIFMTKDKGNCLACHAIKGQEVDGPGSLGPMLQALEYWPDEVLYDKIYDPYTTNPISAMPAFGKNAWLSDKEIKALVAFLKTIK